MDSVFDYVSENLEIKHKNDLKFPYLDHGFLYGYGLFESIKIQDGYPVLMKDHLSRLARGSIILDIPYLINEEAILNVVFKLIKKNNIDKGILNFYLTAGDRSPDPSKLRESPEPLLLIVPRKSPVYSSEDGVVLSVKQESFQRTPLDRVKTMSWMKNVLERKLYPEGDDVLLYNVFDELLESCTANVFFIKGKTLITPNSPVILSGITRQFLLNQKEKLGFEIRHERVTVNQLDDMDELFLTNSSRGVFMVKSVIDYPYLKSGDVARDVQRRYEALIQEHISQGVESIKSFQ